MDSIKLTNSANRLNREKPWPLKIAVALSKIFQQPFEQGLKIHCTGDVLDVGGWDYYLRVKDQLDFDHWTCLEYNADNLLDLDDPNYKCIQGDGCDMDFADATFDTVINNQVLEHVFEPIRMINEIARVLKPGGYGLFIIPQTADLHHAPAHYQNFTRYWIIEAMQRANLEIVELQASGGVWRTIASRSVLFFWHAFKVEGSFIEGIKRPWAFYVLFPFMTIYAVINTVISLILSTGDLVEEATNHIVIVRKPMIRTQDSGNEYTRD